MPFPRFYKLPIEKRERLTEAAAQEFAAYGFDDASMNRIFAQPFLLKARAKGAVRRQALLTVMHPRRERDADNYTLGRLQASDRLPPWLRARVMQQSEAFRTEFAGCGLDRVEALYFKLDARLRHGPALRPVGRAEAGVRGLSQRPDSEVLAARDLLAVEVVVAFAGFKRKPERVDIELAAFGCVGRNDSHARDELDVHDLVPIVDGPAAQFATGTDRP